MPSAQPIKDSAQDTQWISQTLAGDENAFGHLVIKYKDQLFELASRILNSRAEAEDVLQDAFLEAYRHLADFRHKSRFSTWLYSIVLNRVRNRLRQSKVLRWSSLDSRPESNEGYRPPEIAEKSPALEVLTEKRLELESIHKAVRTFPLHYQSIFILHYFNNISLEEVAQRLGRPLGTVKVYLHRARKLLDKRLSSKELIAMATKGRKATHALSMGPVLVS